MRLLRPSVLQAASGLTAIVLTVAGLWLVLAPWPEPASPVFRVALTRSSDPVVTASSDGVAQRRSSDRTDGGVLPPAREAAAEPPANAVMLDDLPTSADDAAAADARSDQW